MAKSYLVQEEDGTSRFLLEDGSGFILLTLGGQIVGTVIGTARAIASVAGGSLAAGTVMGRSRAVGRVDRT